MSATVTGSVLSCPCNTMPSESPTSSASMPASAATRAKVASYAVSTANFSPAAFFACSCGILMAMTCTSSRLNERRIEIVAAMPHGADLFEQQGEIAIAIGEIYLRGVDDQQWRIIVVQKEFAVGSVYFFEIGSVDALLVPDAALTDALRQHIGGGLQINHQIGRGCVQRQLLVDLVVERVFIGVEIDACEQSILGNEKVCDSGRCEQIALAPVLQLLCALEQEKQLRRQRDLARIAVEALEKRILVGLFEHDLMAEGFRQAPRQRGLADADRAFHSNELGRARRYCRTEFCRHHVLAILEVEMELKPLQVMVGATV